MPRSPLFNEDNEGRTSLFRAAESGELQAVEKIIFSLSGTGMSCERLALISHKDKKGHTAIDIAQQAGCKDIAGLLAGEKGRMEFFE